MQENCRRTDSESVRGESRGAGVASGHKDSVVGVDVFRQRQWLSASNSLFSLGAPSLLELAVRFIHLVTHAPGPAGGISKNEGWARRGVCSRRWGGRVYEVCPRYREMSSLDQMQGKKRCANAGGRGKLFRWHRF